MAEVLDCRLSREFSELEVMEDTVVNDPVFVLDALSVAILTLAPDVMADGSSPVEVPLTTGATFVKPEAAAVEAPATVPVVVAPVVAPVTGPAAAVPEEAVLVPVAAATEDAALAAPEAVEAAAAAPCSLP